MASQRNTPIPSTESSAPTSAPREKHHHFYHSSKIRLNLHLQKTSLTTIYYQSSTLFILQTPLEASQRSTNIHQSMQQCQEHLRAIATGKMPTRLQLYHPTLHHPTTYQPCIKSRIQYWIQVRMMR